MSVPDFGPAYVMSVPDFGPAYAMSVPDSPYYARRQTRYVSTRVGKYAMSVRGTAYCIRDVSTGHRIPRA
eukprot:3348081-Rhodomonas_salina.1